MISRAAIESDKKVFNDPENFDHATIQMYIIEHEKLMRIVAAVVKGGRDPVDKDWLKIMKSIRDYDMQLAEMIK